MINENQPHELIKDYQSQEELVIKHLSPFVTNASDTLKPAGYAVLVAERIRELEAALRPFAQLAESNSFDFTSDAVEVESGYKDHRRYAVRVADFRKAAELLNGGKK